MRRILYALAVTVALLVPTAAVAPASAATHCGGIHTIGAQRSFRNVTVTFAQHYRNCATRHGHYRRTTTARVGYTYRHPARCGHSGSLGKITFHVQLGVVTFVLWQTRKLAMGCKASNSRTVDTSAAPRLFNVGHPFWILRCTRVYVHAPDLGCGMSGRF
jgi:hypothetical protein